MINLIDSHAHLDHVENLDIALKESEKAGVSAVLAVSTDLKAMKRNLEIKKQYGSPLKDCGDDRCIKIYLGLGVHPGDIKAEELEESYEFMWQNIQDADVVGEIGLDFWYKWVRKDDAKHREQREVFRRQLEIAKEFDKPVVIHTRGTWKECLATVKEFGIKSANFHWYSGPVDVLEEIIKSGYYVSAGPALAFSPQSREAISHAPIEQTLIETDSPVFFNYPEEMGGGFTATPKDVFKALTAYSQLKNIAPEKAAETLNRNAIKFMKGLS
ncbi:MAG: TatD family hydrolase [Candidatus Omnitrophica bacterium]|nr:TatD family hydrolase [Candidatus Omnitrophota bacterium]